MVGQWGVDGVAASGRGYTGAVTVTESKPMDSTVGMRGYQAMLQITLNIKTLIGLAALPSPIHPLPNPCPNRPPPQGPLAASTAQHDWALFLLVWTLPPPRPHETWGIGFHTAGH